MYIPPQPLGCSAIYVCIKPFTLLLLGASQKLIVPLGLFTSGFMMSMLLTGLHTSPAGQPSPGVADESTRHVRATVTEHFPQLSKSTLPPFKTNAGEPLTNALLRRTPAGSAPDASFVVPLSNE